MDSKIIKQFGSQELAVLRMDIQAAFDILKSKYGLAELTLEGIYFSTSTFNAKISGKTQNFEPDPFEKKEAEFFAIRHGFSENLLGKNFTLDGQPFVITRIEIKNTKYPIIGQSQSGEKTFKFSVSKIKTLLEENKIL